MRIFKDLEFVEYLGSGIPRILGKYTEKAFLITENFLRITFPYEVGELSEATQKTTQKNTQKTTQKILDLIKEKSNITSEELAERIGITPDGIKYRLAKMKNEGIIKRIGADKGGHWELIVY